MKHNRANGRRAEWNFSIKAIKAIGRDLDFNFSILRSFFLTNLIFNWKKKEGNCGIKYYPRMGSNRINKFFPRILLLLIVIIREDNFVIYQDDCKFIFYYFKNN